MRTIKRIETGTGMELRLGARLPEPHSGVDFTYKLNPIKIKLNTNNPINLPDNQKILKITGNGILNLFALIILMVSMAEPAFPHNKTIKGVVMVKNGNAEPVAGATVRLEGTVLGTVSNNEGKFVIRRIPDGKYVIVASCIGMQTVKKEIELKHVDGEELVINFEMEENPVQTSSVVVTATRSEKIYGDVPVKVSTITQADFNTSNSNNIRESLQFQPGVRTEVNCQNCGFSQVRINGLEGKYSQILIDGKAIFSSLNGVYGLDQIPVNMIDRIEIIRGGGSSLYGGNAIAGVINIITKEPCYNSFGINWNNMLVGGKYPENTFNLNGTIINEDQNIGLSIFGMLNQRREYDANRDGYSEIGRMDVKTFGSRLFWKISPRSKLQAEFNTINHEVRGGNKLDLQPHEADITEGAHHSTVMGQIAFEQYLGEGDKLNIYLSGQKTNRNSYYGANQDLNAYGTTENETFAAGANYSALIRDFAGSHIFIGGYEFTSDDMIDKAPAYNRIIDQQSGAHGFYLQDDWSISDQLNFLFGIRLDKHNLIDGIVANPRASILYKLTKGLSLRATYSTGYRAPQAFDEDLHITQVGGEGFVILVADNLEPEYSQSISASADYSLHSIGLPLALSLEFFTTRLNDVFVMTDVGIDNNGNRLLMRENGDAADVTGITFELQSIVQNDFSLKLGATYQASTYSKPVEWSTGNPVAGISAGYSDKIFKAPDLYGYFLASMNFFEDLSLDLSGYYTGPMLVPHYAGYIEMDLLKETDPFFDCSIKLAWNIGKSPDVSLSIGIQNIFDSYQDDFDKGENRDAGYMYGPFRPFTTVLGIKLGY